MENINIFEEQIELLDDKANEILSNIDRSQTIFIIDKKLNMRFLFNYNNSFFISDPIDLEIKQKYINYSDFKFVNNQLVGKLIDLRINMCKYAKLIKNKQSIIDIMIDNLIINIDTINGKLIDIISLEYYNELFLINYNGIYKISKKNDKIKKLNISDIITVEDLKSLKMPTDIIHSIYNNRDQIFPVNNEEILSETNVELEDIVANKSILISTNIASNAIILCQNLKFNTDIKYLEEDIINTLDEILSIKRNDDFLMCLSNIFYNLDLIYITGNQILN